MTDVEYQGTYVLLGLRLTGAAPERSSVSVLLSEKAFVPQPYAVGDSVRLSWAEPMHARSAQAPSVPRANRRPGRRRGTSRWPHWRRWRPERRRAPASS